jgi:hypothetical protein
VVGLSPHESPTAPSPRTEPHTTTECDRSTQAVILTQPCCATPVTCEDLKLAALELGVPKCTSSAQGWFASGVFALKILTVAGC